MTKIDLATLYDLWDSLSGPLNDEGQLLEPFQEFPAGTPVEDVYRWFEAQNSRFIVGHLMGCNGRRLTPLTACIDHAYALDSDGRQVCVGDEILATVNVGRYGQMCEMRAVVDTDHLPYGILDASPVESSPRAYSHTNVGIVFSSAGPNHMVMGRQHNDFEHGYKEVATIVRPAEPQPVERHTPIERPRM